MIKLTLIDRPVELTDEVCQQLTDEYKANKSPVWDKAYIRKALLRMTNHKCAYSEAPLATNGNYWHIEHFRCKKEYEDEVVKWGNLLPSCPTCNVTKGEWDVEKDGDIVNPLVDNPQDFLYVKSFRYKGKNEKGCTTIEKLDLNNPDQFVMPRFQIFERIIEDIESLKEKLSLDKTDRQKSNTIKKFKQCLREASPKKIYSAIIATSILESEEYASMKKLVQEKSLWDNQFDDLENTLKSIALFK
ncbi:MAG: hypothetical protein PUB29_04130 [Bacteroidales bacterium]|nr:hypothetical protein [Bacteroidales bacterium]